MKDFGFDVNGRPIRVIEEHKCPKCGGTTSTYLSDGSVFSGTCGCDYLIELVKAKSNYILVVDSGSYGAEAHYIKGYKEAKEKYKELISSGSSMDVISMAEVVKTNI